MEDKPITIIIRFSELMKYCIETELVCLRTEQKSNLCTNEEDASFWKKGGLRKFKSKWELKPETFEVRGDYLKRYNENT